METLSATDASFLYAETPAAPMHTAMAAIFEGPVPAFDDVVAMMERKLPLVPRYRQRVRFVPQDLGRPVWVDYPRFDLRYHMRRAALPPPGGDAELKEVGARILTQALDVTKPVWEMWMVEGLSDDRWAILTKQHHCMVDGVSGTSLLTVFFNDELGAEHDSWAPGPEPTDQDLIQHALMARQLSPTEVAQSLSELMAAFDPKTAMTRFAQFLEGQQGLREAFEAPARSSLLGPVGRSRRWTWVRYPLAEVKTVRAKLGGTVNDVLLAAIAAGFQTLLQARGHLTKGRTLKTMVPVSTRREQEQGQPSNRIATVYPALPLGVTDPVEALTRIRRQMDGIKQSHQALAAEILTSLVGFQPPELIAQASRVAAQSRELATESIYETVATNVPGPQKPLFMLGRQLLEMVPWIPLSTPVRIGVTISSYNGELVLSIIGDYDSSPDLEVLAGGIRSGLDALHRAATNA